MIGEPITEASIAEDAPKLAALWAVAVEDVAAWMASWEHANRERGRTTDRWEAVLIGRMAVALGHELGTGMVRAEKVLDLAEDYSRRNQVAILTGEAPAASHLFRSPVAGIELDEAPGHNGHERNEGGTP